MNKTRRLEELSILNVLFCLLVVFIHTASHAVSNLDRLSWQYALVAVPQRLSFVAVYGFFFLSGIKLTLPRSQSRSWGEYWLGRVKSLLLPYLLAAAAYYLFFVVIGWYTFDLKFFLSHTALGTLSSPFYFVVALAQFILLAPVFQAMVRRFSPVVVLPVALGVTWLSSIYLPSILKLFLPDYWFPYADRVFTSYLIFYLGGCFAGANYQQFLELLKKNRAFLIPTAAFFTLANGALTLLAFSGRKEIPYLELIHTLYILTAILALYIGAVQITPLGRKSGGSEPGLCLRLFRRIDRASYLIYLYHSLVITVFNNFSARLGITHIGTLLILRILVVFPVAIGGCILWQALYAKCKNILHHDLEGKKS